MKKAVPAKAVTAKKVVAKKSAKKATALVTTPRLRFNQYARGEALMGASFFITGTSALRCNTLP